MEDVCVCGGDFLAWFPKVGGEAYVTFLPVSVPVTRFNSLSNVFQAGQMGGDLSGPKIATAAFSQEDPCSLPRRLSLTRSGGGGAVGTCPWPQAAAMWPASRCPRGAGLAPACGALSLSQLSGQINLGRCPLPVFKRWTGGRLADAHAEGSVSVRGCLPGLRRQRSMDDFCWRGNCRLDTSPHRIQTHPMKMP